MNGLPGPISLLRIAVVAISLVAVSHAADADEQLAEAFTLWQRGYFQHMTGEYGDAIASFSASIEAYPTAQAYTFRGWSLSMINRLEEAIADCKQAIHIDPDYGNPYNDIGVYLIDLGRPDEAIAWLEKAMRAERYCCYEYPHYNLGRIQFAKGQLKEAISSFEKALQYDPGYQPALEALQLIKRQSLDTI